MDSKAVAVRPIVSDDVSDLRMAASYPVNEVALLTGGSDKPYVVGLVGALASQGVTTHVIGSDELDCDDIKTAPGVVFRNLRGDQRENVPVVEKAVRILTYYWRLMAFAAG